MTKILESSYSRGGPCHCGKVGLYAVPKPNSSTMKFFCADHREEANSLMRARHSAKQDRRAGWQGDEFRRDVGRQNYELFKRGGLSER